MNKMHRGLRYDRAVRLVMALAFTAAALLLAAGCNNGGERQEFAVHTVFGSGTTANSYIAASGGEAAVIDTGTPEELLAELKDKKFKLKYIILTHGHFDHIAGVDVIRQKYPGVPVYTNPADREMMADPGQNLSSRFGAKLIVGGDIRPLTEKTVLTLGSAKLEVIPTPGHTPGSVCIKAGNTLFSGDTLFNGAVGRTDFPGGNARDLAASLHLLKKLPDDIMVKPGHDDSTTMGIEKGSNPFLTGEQL